MVEKEIKDLESGSVHDKIRYWTLLTDQGVLTHEIVNWDYQGSGTDEDPYVVEWMDNDPRNPMTWKSSKKWVMCINMAVATLCVSFCSSAFAGGMNRSEL
jgi:hypothetical protein